MTQPINIDDIKALSISDRLVLVEEIWDSIAAAQESMPLAEDRMSQPVIMAKIMALGIPERIRLAQDVWDSVIDEPEALPPLGGELRDELDRRIAAYEADPEAGSTWEEVKSRLMRRG